MKKLSFFLFSILFVLSGCKSSIQIENAESEKTSQIVTRIPIFPTFTIYPTPTIISTIVNQDSGPGELPPRPMPTSTPTWIEYKDAKGNIAATIYRTIAYSDEKKKFYDLPNTDYEITFVRNGQFYKYCVTDLYNESINNSEILPQGIFNQASIDLIQDLDSDGNNEYILISSTLGASCCTFFTIIYFSTKTNNFTPTNTIMRKYTQVPYIVDLNKDKVPEFITCSTDFSFSLGAANVEAAVTPIQIFNYSDKKLINSTKKFPEKVSEEAQYWLSSYQNTNTGDLLFLAAYFGDMYLLGKEEEGSKVFDENCLISFDTKTCNEFKQKVIGNFPILEKNE